MNAHQLKTLLPYLELPFVEKILEEATLMEIPQGQEIIKQDGFIPGVPIVLEGLIKVATHNEDRSLLLYYIKPGQSCVMSFSSCLKGIPSQIFATTQEQTTILLVPIEKVSLWLKEYPSFNTLFYSQFDERYTELLGNIQQLLFHKIDHRLYTYLKTKQTLVKKTALKITHQEIANEMATAREVISRTLKKLESEGKIEQTASGILVL
jgi:CRP/FNR family transcriptional regulator